MLTVDDLTAGLTLQSDGELLGHAVPVCTDAPSCDDASSAKLGLKRTGCRQ
jgi:hypothetical protein